MPETQTQPRQEERQEVRDYSRLAEAEQNANVQWKQVREELNNSESEWRKNKLVQRTIENLKKAGISEEMALDHIADWILFLKREGWEDKDIRDFFTSLHDNNDKALVGSISFISVLINHEKIGEKAKGFLEKLASNFKKGESRASGLTFDTNMEFNKFFEKNKEALEKLHKEYDGEIGKKLDIHHFAKWIWRTLYINAKLREYYEQSSNESEEREEPTTGQQPPEETRAQQPREEENASEEETQPETRQEEEEAERTPEEMRENAVANLKQDLQNEGSDIYIALRNEGVNIEAVLTALDRFEKDHRLELYFEHKENNENRLNRIAEILIRKLKEYGYPEDGLSSKVEMYNKETKKPELVGEKSADRLIITYSPQAES